MQFDEYDLHIQCSKARAKFSIFAVMLDTSVKVVLTWNVIRKVIIPRKVLETKTLTYLNVPWAGIPFVMSSTTTRVVVTQLRNIIASKAALRFLAVSAGGVKFYGLSDAGELFGSKVTFVRKPDHPMDPNCVEVMVI